MIYYYVNAQNPQAHLFDIKMVITSPSSQGQKVSLPNWIPGSYLIRDFARHIVSLQAFSGEEEEALTSISIVKVDSNTWICEPCKGPITLVYRVYAFDLSVRGAYLDTERAFFNGCCLFLRAHEQEQTKYKIKISAPNCEGSLQWRVATTLTRENATPWTYGWFEANSYQELIDHPVEMGLFDLLEYKIRDIPHYIVISGKHDGHLQRLSQDIAKICRAQIDFFDFVPFDRYLFILNIRAESYGGLEHQSSSVLQISRENLPLTMIDTTPGYMGLLGLFSHEYFHAWNVKKIQPEPFKMSNLDHKAYTKQLWAFEGITSYYDNLMLLRAKVITAQAYYDLLSYSITKLLRNPGRKKQTVTESSFDAWIKFYQPNENSVNSIVSYYTKGELVALTLDLALRLQSQHAYSLDDVMQYLLKEYGMNNQGVDEEDIEKILEKLGGKELSQLLYQALYTTQDLPLVTLLDKMGLSLTLRQACNAEDMGGKIESSSPKNTIAFQPGRFGFTLSKNERRLLISQVLEESAAEKAGLCACDEIIALNGYRTDALTYDKISKRLKAGEKVEVQYFRQDILKHCTVVLEEQPFDTAQIALKSDLNEQEKQNLERWLS